MAEQTPQPADPRPRRRGPAWYLTRIGLPLVLVAGAVVAMVLIAGPDASAQASDGAARTPSARVQRRDIVEREDFSGTLGFADTRTVTSGGIAGTLTWIAGEGALRRRNQILYTVDESPVVLMYGTTPAYRDMTEGDEGRDVLQLERNLTALGYTDDGNLDVDGDFDWATTQAVEDWQDDLGLDQTGTVERGRVVFLPGERRVSKVSASLGGQAGGPVLQTTSLRRNVTVDLDARQQDLLSLGDRVRVELPDGSIAVARVTSVSTVATAGTDGADPTIPVTLNILGAAGADLPDSAPVTVKVATDKADDVLAAPINALLALQGGGFGLERINADGSTTIVSARIGLSADGWVQVSGPNVVRGMRVVVAE